jgi:hypothetical protein
MAAIAFDQTVFLLLKYPHINKFKLVSGEAWDDGL